MNICGDYKSPLKNAAMTEATATVAALPYSRTNPFPARMLVNRRLSGPESEKDTRHFELDLTGWGLSFEVGDSVGVYPTNDPDLVDEIIRALGATGDEKVPRLKGEPTTLREALLRDYSVTQPTPKFLKAIAQRADAAPTLHYLLAPDRKQDLQTVSLGHGSDRFSHRTPIRALHAGGICRAALKTPAATVFGSFEPEGVSRSSAFDCGRRSLRE